jgi:hypothetical protein
MAYNYKPTMTQIGLVIIIIDSYKEAIMYFLEET